VPVVTSLEPESHSGGLRIRLDGEPFGTVSASDVADLRLAVGRDLPAAMVAELGRRAEAFGVRALALRMLAARPLPSLELVRRLVRKGHAKALAEAAVDGLVSAGLLDDGEVARHYVRTRVRQRRLGPGRLVADLRRMGIAEGEAAAAVAETIAADGVDTGALLREAARRKLRTLTKLEPAVRARRLQAFLLRRGFAASDVIAVVKEATKR
jgi:SOS response regulatory protein OraA/RecX